MKIFNSEETDYTKTDVGLIEIILINHGLCFLVNKYTQATQADLMQV